MTFKLNALVATLVMAASAPAFAQISNGADGNGELFFTMWDSTNSYSRDLNITIDAFETALAVGGPLNLSFAADATFTSFLSTANSSELMFNVVATDAQGARRLLETFTAPKPTTTKANDVIRTAIGNVQSFANDLNTKLSCSTSVYGCDPLGGDSAIYGVGTPGYGGDIKFNDDNNNKLNFSNAGSMGNNSYANGLSFMRINAAATGIASSTYTPYLDDGIDVRVYMDGTNGLHIAAAVPEAETYAMMLAGLGLVGFMVRRRNHFA